jgi:aminotransferase
VAKYSLSPGLPELRELIEISLAKENMFYDWQNEIVVTAGSIEGITAAIMAITEPGDEIIIPEPTYTSYREVIILAGCKPVLVPLNEEKGWAFELDKYESAVTPKTKAIFYCNPNNPTGTIYTKEQLLGLAEIAKKHDLFLMSDDVYKDFPLDGKLGEERVFSLAEVPELRERVIRLFSFSKAFAMTGWRVGYVHSDARVIREILKVHDCLVTCAPVISQFAAMGALEAGEKEIEDHLYHYRLRRDLICSKLEEMKDFFSFVRPRGAYYAFPKIISDKLIDRLLKMDFNDSSQGYNPNRLEISNDMKESLSWRFALDLIDKARVAVVPGVAFGPSGEAHFRLNFGRSEKDIEQAMERIGRYLSI